MKISFCIVAHNEERLIERCLASVVGVADEILFVHDGPCTDQTISIVEQFTDKIFIRQREHGAEPHRVFLLEQAAHSWVFMIDADEFLSKELSDLLLDPSFTLEGYGAMSVYWPLWNGSRYVTHTNWRSVLFHKEKCWSVGLHDYPIYTIGRMRYEPVVLEHMPQESKIGLSRAISASLRGRIERNAAQLMEGYDTFPKYNEALIPKNFSDSLRSFIAHPARHLCWRPIKYFLGSLKNSYKDGYYGLVSSVQLAYFQFEMVRAMVRIQRLRRDV